MNNKKPYRSQFVSPIHKAYRQAVLYLEGDGAAELGSSDAHLLAYVVSYGPCTAGELARVFGLRKPTLTGVLDRLERPGYLRRRLSPDDRRSFLIEPLQAGRDYIAKAGKKFERLERDIARHVSKADLEGFRKVMDAFSIVTGIEVRVGPDVRPEKGTGGDRK